MKILFVCTSNKDRSPALEKHFREKYPQHEYRSAGINAHFTNQHRTHFLTKEDVEWADLVVGAEEIHADRASSIAMPSETRTYTFLNLGDFHVDQMWHYVELAEYKLKEIMHGVFVSTNPIIHSNRIDDKDMSRILDELKNTPLTFVSRQEESEAVTDIGKLAEENWDEVNSQFKEGLNPYAHRVGFIEGYKAAMANKV